MTNKATAKAHAMQGLLKYHGMKDSKLRIPYHDSISVCLDALFTKTTVEFGNFEKDELTINNEIQQDTVLSRALAIIDKIPSSSFFIFFIIIVCFSFDDSD